LRRELHPRCGPDGSTYDYYHLLGFERGITAGASVAAGAPIARMGSSGCSTGPHLHLTVRTPDGREINPFTVLEP
jgi:murein DD-endopeptidase MepM/ murein hydrolase activator NlpD